MVFYLGQEGRLEYFTRGEIGREDGQSEVTIQKPVVKCNRCGATYTDKESIELAEKWIKEGYAPCPNIACQGELELREV